MRRTFVEIDGSRLSGSGAIVRQAVAYAALTRTAIHVTNARALRREPGLRQQHVCVIEAIAELAGARTNGVGVGSREFTFEPYLRAVLPPPAWDIGTAGS
ncbi:MAG TPA: RNA 3'-terminal phosphate cyclase, partial [Coriobacteriia bacterium]